MDCSSLDIRRSFSDYSPPAPPLDAVSTPADPNMDPGRRIRLQVFQSVLLFITSALFNEWLFAHQSGLGDLRLRHRLLFVLENRNELVRPASARSSLDAE